MAGRGWRGPHLHLITNGFVQLFRQIKDLFAFAQVRGEEGADSVHETGTGRNGGLSRHGVHCVQRSANHFVHGVDVVQVEFGCATGGTGRVGNGVETIGERIVQRGDLTAAFANSVCERSNDRVHQRVERTGGNGRPKVV